MGFLYEDRPRRRRGLGGIERDILDELSGADLLYGFLHSGRSTRAMYRSAREHAAYRHRRKRAIERLKDFRFIEQKGERLTITAAGTNALGAAVLNTRGLLKSQTWDGKWRIAAFDIPERYASLRNKVRNLLKEAGFLRLQHSIWIFPHECNALVQLIKEESALSKYILYGLLDSIEDEERLRKLFKL